MKNRRHLSTAAEYPCIICGNPNVEIHHITTGAGMGRKNPDSHALSLCHIHHRTGGYGIAIHAGRKAWEEAYSTEKEMLYTFLCQLENERTLTEYALPTLLKLRLQYT